MLNLQSAAMRRTSRFSLIELLIVIAIIGILAATLIPRFANIEKDSREVVDNYNIADVGRFIEMFKAANGYFPSGFHTGLNGREDAQLLVDTATGISALPAVISNQLSPTNLEIVTLTQNQKQSLYSSGINFLAYGHVRKPEIIYRDNSNKYNLISVQKINNESGDALTFNNRTIPEWLAKESLTAHDDDYDGIVVMLFVGPTVDWQTVYAGAVRGHDDHFHFDGEKASKVSVSRLPSAVRQNSNASFRHYIAFFKLFDDGSEAKFIGVTSPELQTATTAK